MIMPANVCSQFSSVETANPETADPPITHKSVVWEYFVSPVELNHEFDASLHLQRCL